MGVATFLSRIFGLVREQVMAFLFGAGMATDAFNIAFRIPNLLRDLFAEGAMSSALVPTFTRVRAEQGERRAWRVAGLVFVTLFILVGLLAGVGMFFAPELVRLYAGAYTEVPGKYELTVVLTRIMFPFFPLVALAAAFMGILNACGKFFFPAFASALFNITSVLVGIALYLVLPGYGIHPIVGMAIGVVAGGVVQAFSQLPVLWKAGFRWRSRSSEDPPLFREPALRQMLFLMVPGTIGLAATQINVLVNSILATSEGAGAVSWLNYAFRLMQFPIGVFGVSLAAATLPRVSALWVSRDGEGIAQTLSSSLRHVFAVNLPASAGLAFLGVPIVQLLFEYGRFTSSDTHATAMALAAYAAGLAAYSTVKVLVPACYALGNTRLPVTSSVLSVGVTIGLNLLLIGPFSYVGLALGTSLAAIFNALFLLLSIQSILRRNSFHFPLWPLAKSFAIHLIVALAMGLACWGTYRLVDPLWDLHLPGRLLKVGLLVLEGALITVIFAKVFKLQETLEAVELFSGKLKKKLSKQ